jgi:AraC-like DNA-binding protein
MPPLHWSVPLEVCPEIVYSGVGRHGRDEPFHFYKLTDLWALHIYDYEGTLETQGQGFPIRKGLVSLIRPDTGFRHIWSCPDSTHVYYLFKLRETNKTGTIPVIQSLPSLESFALQAGIAARFVRDPARATARLWEILFSISKPNEGLQPRVPAAVRHAIEEMERNLHRKVSVSQVARNAGLSHNQLTRLFQKHFGRTVLEYLADLRWERISRLLTNTEIPSKQIAYEFRFSDSSHFNKFVRERAGMSPRALRARTHRHGTGLANP